MPTINDLKAQRDVNVRSAKNMLAEMGSRRWNPQEQAKFDRYVDEAESAQGRIDAAQIAAGQSDAVSAHYREGLEIFLRNSPNMMSAAQLKTVRNAMSTTTGSQGGFTVAPMIASEMVSLLKGYGWMRRVARRTTTEKGNDMSYPTSDGTGEVGELLAQNAPASSLDPSFGTAPIPTYSFSSKVFTVPMELLQDSQVDIVSFIMGRARDRIGRSQNAFFTTGTGTNQPTGLVTASSVGKTGTTGQTLTVTYDDLVDLADSVDEGHLGMPDAEAGSSDVLPGWMFSQTTRKVIRKLKDTNGRPIWVPAAGGELPQLLDAPVYINNDMPAPAANAKSIAFGNLNSYMIRDVLEVRLHRFDDSAYALKGQVGFLGVVRSGGALLDSGAVKLYQHSAT
ncbi:phage major capsid protein, HK97 family [Variovorax sp. PBL-H6]|uniref:phage major capsid protein n=1 Tax=Variovorax sp. PBL-H6 TaxID=434009 RepID=UPI001317B911|nr:phage major capsid protein [Variovorax sp. PBL-H6]VTU29468.1 phage major capsid protein, HK97 family [Variovorax sp. PBL-H6]